MKEPQIKARALVLTMQLQGLEFEDAIRCAFVAVEELIDCTFDNATFPADLPVNKHKKQFWIEAREELMKL